ncbi:MAG: tetratricopeptide repeat protein [Parasphingopyxis sp.]|nr:tetratricopeptide repeat protein [Sphingomonadales bacterium]
MALIGLLLGLTLPVPALADWRRAESDNFIVYAEMRQDRIRDYVLELERFDRTLRHLTRQQGDFAPVKLRILVLSDTDDVSAYGDGNYTGFYMADIRGPYAVVPKRGAGWGAFEIERREILFYQYTHHFMAQYFPANYPAWYREGLAQLYSTVEFQRDGRIDVGRAARSIANQLGMFERAGYWLPMRDLLSNVYPNSTLAYGEGWLLAHQAMFDPRLRRELGEYLNALHQGNSGREAYDQVFANRDPSLDQQLREYLVGYSFPYVPMELDLGAIAEPTITVMSDAEAELALLRGRPVEAMESDLQEALEDHPDNAQVYAEQARFLLGQGNFAEAREAADRALAIAPDNIDAHLFAAQALIWLGVGDAASPHWGEARNHALQANRLDPDNAMALVFYFLSYPDAAARPDNALPALERAFALIPQNTAIRTILGREYLDQGRYAEARRVVSAVAGSAYGDPYKDYAAILERLASRELDISHAGDAIAEINAEREQRRAELGEMVAIDFLPQEPVSRFNHADWMWNSRRSLFQNRVP